LLHDDLFRLKLKREKKDSNSMALSYHTMADILRKTPSRLEEAMEWAQKSLCRAE